MSLPRFFWVVWMQNSVALKRSIAPSGKHAVGMGKKLRENSFENTRRVGMVFSRYVLRAQRCGHSPPPLASLTAFSPCCTDGLHSPQMLQSLEASRKPTSFPSPAIFKSPDPGAHFKSVIKNSYDSITKGGRKKKKMTGRPRIPEARFSVPSPGSLWPRRAAVAGLARSQRGEEPLSAGLPCWRDSERCHGSDGAERYIVPHSAHHVPHLLGEGNGCG